MKMTRAQENRKIRQEALRDQLASQGHIQHVLEIAKKLQSPEEEIDKGMVDRYKIVIDTKMRLINKYLPDLKSVEAEVDAGGVLAEILSHIAEAELGLPGQSHTGGQE